MKRGLALLLAAALWIGTVGCGNGKGGLAAEETASEEAAYPEETFATETFSEEESAFTQESVYAEESRFSQEGLEGLMEETPSEESDSDSQALFREQTDRPKVRGIYVTGPMAGTSNMDALIELVERTELNALVIDIKNDEGYVTFEMDTPLVQEIGSAKRYVKDMTALVEKCKEKGIYLIARIVAFRDPVLAQEKPEWCLHNADGTVFYDKSGLAWVNPYEEQAWEYLLEVAEGAIEAGFDEVQFDYLRFSTDSGMKQVDFGEAAQDKSKTEVIAEFAAYAANRLHEKGAAVSADVYGVVIDSATDQQIVGQDYVALATYLDYVSPMVYPSHYGANYYNIAIPDAQPYDTVLAAMQASKKVLAGVMEPRTETDAQDSESENTVSENTRSGNAASGNTIAGNAASGNAATQSTAQQELTAEEIAALAPMETVRADVRPWLQDFTATWVSGHIRYGAEQIRDQIQAVYDAGYEEWILWNAANRYTEEGLYGADGQPAGGAEQEAGAEAASEPEQKALEESEEMVSPELTEPGEQGGM